jgi:hypothetical protein
MQFFCVLPKVIVVKGWGILGKYILLYSYINDIYRDNWNNMQTIILKSLPIFCKSIDFLNV